MKYIDLLAHRNQPGEEICSAYAEYTREAFGDETSLPVIIPTYNESDDLPLTLVALARSSIQVQPIVVDSGSPDNTGEIASDMGAKVLTIGRGQMLAYKTGIEHVQRTRGTSPLLITDADTLPQSRWAEVMLRKAQLVPEIGGIAFGTTVFHEGPSRLTDVVRSGYAILGDVGRLLLQRPARMRGSNCLIQLDEDERVLRQLRTHEDRAFPCDVILGTDIAEVTGRIVSVTHPYATVFSRGDRYENMSQLAQIFWGEKTGGISRASLYADHGINDK